MGRAIGGCFALLTFGLCTVGFCLTSMCLIGLIVPAKPREAVPLVKEVKPAPRPVMPLDNRNIIAKP